MKTLVEMIAKNLVDEVDEVKVIETIEENGTVKIELTVAKNDMGKIIGKKGKSINSIRTIVKSMAVSENKRVILDIVE